MKEQIKKEKMFRESIKNTFLPPKKMNSTLNSAEHSNSSTI